MRSKLSVTMILLLIAFFSYSPVALAQPFKPPPPIPHPGPPHPGPPHKLYFWKKELRAGNCHMVNASLNVYKDGRVQF